MEKMTVNGFTFRVIKTGPQISDRRYEAIRGEIILKSKNLNYLKKLAKKYS
jgi:hypothetical protein